MKHTTGLRAALAASHPDQPALMSCAQHYSASRHFVIYGTSAGYLLSIDEYAFPPMSLEAIERILTTGNLRIPLTNGWLGQAPAHGFPPRPLFSDQAK